MRKLLWILSAAIFISFLPKLYAEPVQIFSTPVVFLKEVSFAAGGTTSSVFATWSGTNFAKLNTNNVFAPGTTQMMWVVIASNDVVASGISLTNLSGRLDSINTAFLPEIGIGITTNTSSVLWTNTVSVSGGGQTDVNGIYTWNAGTGRYESGLNRIQFNGIWTILDSSDTEVYISDYESITNSWQVMLGTEPVPVVIWGTNTVITYVTNSAWYIAGIANAAMALAGSAVKTSEYSLASAAAKGGFSGTETISPKAVNSYVFGYAAGSYMADGLYNHLFGENAGRSSTAEYSHFFGYWSGNYASGQFGHACGSQAGSHAGGSRWHAYGWQSGYGASGDNWTTMGSWAGSYNVSDNMLYIDQYPWDSYFSGTHSPTNDSIVIDGTAGKLFLGRPAGDLYLRGNIHGLDPAKIGAVLHTNQVPGFGGTTNTFVYWGVP